MARLQGTEQEQQQLPAWERFVYKRWEAVLFMVRRLLSSMHTLLSVSVSQHLTLCARVRVFLWWWWLWGDQAKCRHSLNSGIRGDQQGATRSHHTDSPSLNNRRRNRCCSRIFSVAN